MRTYQEMVRYLKHYCKEPSYRESLLDKRTKLENTLEGLKSPKMDGEMIIGGGSKDERWIHIIQELEEVQQEMNEIILMINQLEGKQSIVLQEYFIKGKTHEQIANDHIEEKGYSLRSVQEYYRKGIIQLIEKDL